jgi:periplasmic divalent cation tolerance protein
VKTGKRKVWAGHRQAGIPLAACTGVSTLIAMLLAWTTVANREVAVSTLIPMLLAWTTVANREVADRLAAEAVARGLAACAQIDGPIVSHYRWETKLLRDEEFRLCFKFLPDAAAALEQFVLASHPYETPEWIVVKADATSEKYLSWARANSSNPPL